MCYVLRDLRDCVWSQEGVMGKQAGQARGDVPDIELDRGGEMVLHGGCRTLLVMRWRALFPSCPGERIVQYVQYGYGACGVDRLRWTR
jgi:hypothetical protein